jgi:hypothetical protein
MDSSYVGRYGTLSLMKKDGSNIPSHTTLLTTKKSLLDETQTAVFGYTTTISKLHCKVTFEDAKVRAWSVVLLNTLLKLSQAFLTVYGTSGLVADGFPLFPTATGPTTVPLGNNTEIEIHRKRFIFTYPPKDLRAMILATPEPDRNGKEEEDSADVHDR